MKWDKEICSFKVNLTNGQKIGVVSDCRHLLYTIMNWQKQIPLQRLLIKVFVLRERNTHDLALLYFIGAFGSK